MLRVLCQITMLILCMLPDRSCMTLLQSFLSIITILLLTTCIRILIGVCIPVVEETVMQAFRSIRWFRQNETNIEDWLYGMDPFVLIGLDTPQRTAFDMRPFHEDDENVHDSHIQAHTRHLIKEENLTPTNDIKVIYDLVKQFPQHKKVIKDIALLKVHYYGKDPLHILHNLVMKANKDQLHHLDTIFFKEFDKNLCLSGMMTRLFEAMEIHDPESLPVPHGQLMQEMLQSAKVLIEEEQIEPSIMNERLTHFLQPYQTHFERPIADIVASWDLPSLYE